MTATRNPGPRPARDFFWLSERGNAANEDFALATPSYGIVIDGASGLAGEPLFPERFRSNAQWLSHTVGRLVCGALDAGAGVPEALSAAVAAARRELEGRLGGPLGAWDPDAVPSATLALATVGADAVELYGLGDSPLLALMRDGTLVTSTDEALEALDAAAVAASRERAGGRPLSGPERRALVSDVVLANRRLRNSPGGYWCLDPTGVGLGHLRRVTLPRAEVAAVAGMSDGLWRAFGQFGVADAAAELPALTEARARALLARLRELEAADPDYVRFPRLKGSDDASTFWLRP